MADDVRSARAYIRRSWMASQAVCLRNDSNWHRCSRERCNIVHLKTFVCMADGCHACSTEKCSLHPDARVVLVNNLWACRDTGHVHECNACSSTCHVERGVCCISGRETSANDILVGESLSGPTTNRRCRRKRPAAHTNHQIACILLYDLLFSKRRRAYEESRQNMYNDIARRQGVKYARARAKEGKPLIMQDIMDIYVCNRERLRPVQHLYAYTDAEQQKLCRAYATIVYRVWVAFSTRMSRRVTFDSAAAALLYHMRRGLALDGMNIVPMDTFLFKFLPGTFLRCPQFCVFTNTIPPQMHTLSRTSESAEEHSHTPKTRSPMHSDRQQTPAAQKRKKSRNFSNSKLTRKQKIESFLRSWALC